MSQQLAPVQSPEPTAADPTRRVDCSGPIGYSVSEVVKGEARYVDIKQGDRILGSIRIFIDSERNGFALDDVKKTTTGFEIAVEYGSRYFYHKRFIFICKQQKFYLSKVMVDSFDKVNPQRWWKKETRVRPILPLEKFILDDFMLEGVAH
jgi:hypothetical protein